MSNIAQRKTDHLDLCNSGNVAFANKTTLLDEVHFVHDALPELRVDDIDLSVDIFGKTLKLPLFIAAMTGGTERAGAINRELAKVAQDVGCGFGLGSQRPMLKDPSDRSYIIRDVAPDCVVLGNLAGVQARDLTSKQLEKLAADVGADAICLHLNPAMELIQEHGDRDFVGVLDTIRRAAADLSIPVIAKETGCGLSRNAITRLVEAGVKHVDVSGSGGTSWVAVEAERAIGAKRSLGDALREWGIPTGASVAIAAQARPALETIIATGGLKTGLDIARAIALGATAGGIARPVLQAQQSGGSDAVKAFIATIEAELRAVMLLVGAKDVAALRNTPILRGPTLTAWTAI